MNENQPEKAPKPAAAPLGQARGQDSSFLSVGGTFTTGLNASLDLSEFGDLENDTSVEIYAAKGDPPTARCTGNLNRCQNYVPAPNSFGTIDGGAWSVDKKYWIQVIDNSSGTVTVYQGQVDSPVSSTDKVSIRLNEKPNW